MFMLDIFAMKAKEAQICCWLRVERKLIDYQHVNNKKEPRVNIKD